MNIEELIKFFENNPVNTSLLGGSKYNPKAMAYSTLAKEAYDKDDFVIAISLYSKALEFQPLNWHFLSQRAICYRMLNEYDKSLADALSSKKRDDNFINNQTIALCYLFKKDFLKAIQHFDIAINHLDHSEEKDLSEIMGINYAATKSRVLNNQAVCYYNLQQLDKAIECTTKGIQAKPDYSNNYFIRGMIYLSQDNKKKAILDLQNAERYGDTRANSILAEIKSQSPNLTSMTDNEYNYLGVNQLNIDNFLTAINNLSKSIELNPNNSIAFYKRGFAQAEIRNFSKAIEDLTKAIEIDKNFVDAYRLLGICQYNTGVFLEAKKNFEAAIMLGDKDAEVLISLFDSPKDINGLPF